jgi:Na+/H+ antiporter NhaD/arsenite permease-like protein
MLRKLSLLVLLPLLFAFLSKFAGATSQQTAIIGVFAISILGTLLFWDLRLGFLFVGGGALFLIHSINLEQFIQYASLDVIFFLVGMMIVVASMKDSGLFEWLVSAILKTRNLGGMKMFVMIMLLSAVFSGLTGEAASIMVMVAIILELCDLLEINPVPLIISSVLATNIGSAATLFGNPIGIIIALRGKLSFEDFLTHALPISVFLLAIAVSVLGLWYRKYIKELSSRLKAKHVEILARHSIRWDAGKQTSLIIFTAMLLIIALHKRLEVLLGLESNTLLIITPIVFAGFVIFLHRARAINYIENGVEWGSLLFFMFLFVQAGVIQSSGVAQFFAEKLMHSTGGDDQLLCGVTIFSSGLLSGVLDNTVVVASFVPVVKNLHMTHMSLRPLWWCLLFGACLGGNLTAIGSTANIIAVGMLEKQRKTKLDFVEWLKIGTIVTLVTLIVAFVCVVFVPFFGK